MLPDVLTEGDNLEMPPLPDASFLFDNDVEATPRSRKQRAASRELNFGDEFGNSQFLTQSVLETQKQHYYRDDDQALAEDIDDLGLDLGDSIEVGRDAPAARPIGDELDDTADLNFFDKTATSFADRQHSMNISIADQDDGFPRMDDDGDVNMFLNDDTIVPLATPAKPGRERISESPLSDIDPAAEREAEAAVLGDESAFFPGDDTEHTLVRQPAQRIRKTKILGADTEIMISTSAIKEQQKDRSKILRPKSFLPRDPTMLALSEMNRHGGLLNNILSDARSENWAPELRGLLSLDEILKSRSADLKRKRDSGVADLEDGQADPKSPRLALDLGDEDTLGNISATAGLAGSFPADGADGNNTIIELEDGFQPMMDEDEGFGAQQMDNTMGVGADSPSRLDVDGHDFDETRAPLVHPEDSGPVSQYTKHAVHLLREKFAADAPADGVSHSPSEPSSQRIAKASTLFQELLPEKSTSRADATKMFFEVLVLATKDAVKVEQREGELGGMIRVRAKRGLWGAWAEEKAGGEIETQELAEGEGLGREMDGPARLGLEGVRGITAAA